MAGEFESPRGRGEADAVQFVATVSTEELPGFFEPCPYLPGQSSRGELISGERYFGLYESLLPLGWRRSGKVLYRYRCEGCTSCIPLRIPASKYPPSSARAKKLARRNADLSIRLLPANFNDEHFRLYEKYIRLWHGESDLPAEEGYASLLAAPIARVSEYRDRAGMLVGIGFLDILPSGFSSAYFAFDPDQASRSLGSYSIYAESELALSMGKRYYYLGFWVPGARKMDYKADFPPFQLALPRDRSMTGGGIAVAWEEFRDKREALARLSALAHR